jgi:hypothetical protein
MRAPNYMKHFTKSSQGWVCKLCGCAVPWPSTHALFHEFIGTREGRLNGK